MLMLHLHEHKALNSSVLTTILSAWRQKGLTGYCFKYTDRPFCLQVDDFCIDHWFRKYDPLLIYNECMYFLTVVMKKYKFGWR